MPLKPVLLVSYYFPPLGGPGAIRPAKFCKYLPKFGWQPVVLTVKDIAYYTHDEYLIEDTASCAVTASRSFDPARILYRLGKKSLTWTGSASPLAPFFNLPDSKLGWLVPAVLKGLSLARSARVIMATAPPFTSLLVGLVLSKLANKPLVADFRDAWLEFPFIPYKGVYRYINYRLEQEVAKHVDRVISVSRAIADNLTRRYPWLESRMTIVPNGFDPADFGRATEGRDFTITHLGTLRKFRDTRPILAAIRQLIDEKQISPGTAVKFIGNIVPDLLDNVRELHLEKNVILHHYLPHREAMRELNSSHVLFMLSDPESHIFPSRQAEYLATGCPILLIGAAASSELLAAARTDHGYPVVLVGSDDIKTIKGEIHKYYIQYQEGRLRRRPLRLPDFDRRVQAQRIAAIFDDLTSQPR